MKAKKGELDDAGFVKAVAEALADSTLLEVSDDAARIRRKTPLPETDEDTLLKQAIYAVRRFHRHHTF